MTRNIEKIRNIGVVAHIDAGKTTVTERMLFLTGTTHRMGDVDRGTTETDFDPEEQQRGITIYSAAVTFRWNDVTVNLIDTPGHVDFTAEVERSLRVLDGAVVVFSAREGVEAQSETVWRQADKYRVPRVAFINKMDREGADFEGTVREIRERRAAPLVTMIPVGAGPPHVADAFRGLIDLVEMKLLVWEKESLGAEFTASEIPDDLRKRAESARGELLEQLYNFSDELMEKALGDEPIEPALIRRVLRSATLEAHAVPVLCGSALDYIGVQPVLDAVGWYLPSPLDVPPVQGVNPKKKDAEERRKPSEDDPFCGLVFKIVADKHGDLSYVRVYSGVLKAGSRAYNPGKDKKENIAQLWHIQADDRKQVESVGAGDIAGVIGLRNSVTGDTLCDPKAPVLLETIAFPETVLSMAIEPESSADRKKLADVLEMLKRQDPTFRATESEDTGQTLISGMGELHLEVIQHRLLRDFKLNVKVHKPRVSYRETVERKAEVEGECRRQVAGQNWFAKVRIGMEPGADPSAATQVLSTVGDSLPGEFVAAATDELRERAGGGGKFGYPLLGTKITLLGGEASEEQSNEAAFRIAAAEAFEEGLQAAGATLLEPIMKLQITTPEDHFGDFIGDLQQRRGEVVKTTIRGVTTVIDAQAPLGELFGYSSAMRSMSGGRASCSMEPAGYGPASKEVVESMTY